MKKLIFSLTLLLFAARLFSQTPAPSKEYYLKKSKTQKTIGWVMLGGGVAMAALGLAIANKQATDDPFGTLENLDKADGLVVLSCIGMASALGSIPFFISSAKNARRSATISVNYQKILFPQQNTLALKTQPAFILKIKL